MGYSNSSAFLPPTYNADTTNALFRLVILLIACNPEATSKNSFHAITQTKTNTFKLVTSHLKHATLSCTEGKHFSVRICPYRLLPIMVCCGLHYFGNNVIPE
jgi:hypothetical protein